MLAGVVAGFLPLAHLPTLLAIAMVTPFLVFLLNRRLFAITSIPWPGWIAFHASWVLVALPQLALQLRGGSSALSAFRVELGWLSPAEKHHAALTLLAFSFLLQLTASILAFLARDAAVGTALGVLSGTWLATGLVWLAALVDNCVDLARVKARVELGATGVANAVNRPWPALLDKRFVVGRVPVACGHHELELPREAVDRVNDGVAVRHGQCPAWAKVVLDVDHDQGVHAGQI